LGGEYPKKNCNAATAQRPEFFFKKTEKSRPKIRFAQNRGCTFASSINEAEMPHLTPAL